MTPLLLSLALCLAPGDDDVVCVVGEDEHTATQYGAWLVERYGHGHVQEYTREMTALAAARDDGRLPDEAALEAAYLDERERVVEEFHRGDLERWARDLALRGFTPESWRRHRLSGLRVELVLDAYARAARTPDEADLRRRYEDVYGGLGEAVSLDVAFFSAYAGVDPDAGRPDMQALRDAALARARAARTALDDGGSVGELPGTDPVDHPFVEEGHVALYRRNLLGPEVDRAVSSLDRPGDVTPPIMAWNGYYLVQLVSRRAVTFEEARANLEAMALSAPVTSEERAEVMERLMDRYGSRETLR